MIAVHYQFETVEPLLITGLEGDANTKRSLDYIPGSALRGALIGRYLRRRRQLQLDVAGDAVAQRLFLQPSTRYLNAYLMLEIEAQRRRSLPTPLSWQRDKAVPLQEDSLVVDRALLTAAELTPGIQLKPLGGYGWQEHTRVYTSRPLRYVQIHTARERYAGRATAAEGAIFQYDALADGQYFMGSILVNEAEDAKLITELLTDYRLYLGGAQSAGYGEVRVHEVQSQAWYGETGLQPRGLEVGDTLHLTALSPWLLEDVEGNAVTLVDGQLAADWLKIPPDSLTLLPEQSWRELMPVGGFNRTWGLPLPQRQAIASGSIFTFRVNTSISDEALRTLQTQGVGGLRLDGFGQVAVNWPQDKVLYYTESTPIRDSTPAEVPDPRDSSAQKVLAQMAQRILARELDQDVTEQVYRLRLQDASLVSNHLLNRLRAEVQRAQVRLQELQSPPANAAVELSEEALTEAVFKPVCDFLDQLKFRAQVQLQRARFERDQETLETWLRQRLTKAQSLWYTELSPPPPVTFGRYQSHTTQPEIILAFDYTLQLIDRVLAQAARQKGQP